MPQPKAPIDNLLISAAVFLLLPLLPLLLELIITFANHPESSVWLETNSVMITAPIFAVGVGLASRFRSAFAYLGLLSILLAALYGAQASQKRDLQGVPDAKVQAAQPSVAEGSADPRIPHNAETASPAPTFWSRIGMTNRPALLAWLGIFFSTIMFAVERYARHMVLIEPFEFEWDK